MEDVCLVFCKGEEECPAFVSIPFNRIRRTLRNTGYATMDEFREGFICAPCIKKFEEMVSAPQSP
jgi:hypothetical protein